MISLLIKKTFYDLWDNMFKIFFMNLGALITIALAVFTATLVSWISVIPELIKIHLMFFIMVLIINIYIGTINCFVRDIADYKQPGFKDFFSHLKKSLLVSTLYSVAMSLVVFIFNIAFSFWSSSHIIPNTFIADAAKIFLICAAIICILSSQFFYPIYAGLDKNFFKIIKKMFLIFLDNPLFSFVIFGLSLLTLILSVFTVFMVPGITCIPLLLNVGLKLRLLKYDYLEQKPDADPSKIPWDKLLIEEKERVGTRTLKGMIFPWKD